MLQSHPAMGRTSMQCSSDMYVYMFPVIKVHRGEIFKGQIQANLSQSLQQGLLSQALPFSQRGLHCLCCMQTSTRH